MPDGEKTWTDVLKGAFYTAAPICEYQDYDEDTWRFFPAECVDYTPVTESTTAWSDGWYVAENNVTIENDVWISGDVHLILKDHAILMVEGDITGGGTFRLYAQSDGDDMGRLKAGLIRATGGKNAYIYGGAVKAAQISSEGDLAICGGRITAESDFDAVYSDQELTIYGGRITASGATGVSARGKVTIHNGLINAHGKGYGIYSVDSIDTYGGRTVATGDVSGICTRGEIYITSGDVTAEGGEGRKALRYGEITVSVTVAVFDKAEERVLLPEKTTWKEYLTGTYYRFVPKRLLVPYLSYDEKSGEFEEKTYLNPIVIDENTKALEGGTWYAAEKTKEISGNVAVSGDVHIILTDGSTLAITGTVSGKDAHLYLHAQSTEDTAGRFACSGADGGNVISVKALTVDGGVITAEGGGDAISATALTVNGGIVTAEGGENGSGIVSESGEPVIVGLITVKPDADGDYIPLPADKSVSDYRFIKITKEEGDVLTLTVNGREYTVTAEGKDAGAGVIAVALYESAEAGKLLELAVFDLGAGDAPGGTFTEDGGVVKAFWWSDVSCMKPLCEAAEKITE